MFRYVIKIFRKLWLCQVFPAMAVGTEHLTYLEHQGESESLQKGQGQPQQLVSAYVHDQLL